MRLWRWCVVIMWMWLCHWCQGVVEMSEPGLKCLPDETERCSLYSFIHNIFNFSYTFTIDGEHVIIDLFKDFNMKCQKNVTLDTSILPRSETPIEGVTANFKNCEPLQNSYASILSAMNVQATDELTIYGATHVLTRDNLLGLENITYLEFGELELAPDALDVTPHLQRLGLYSVSQVSIERLPKSLLELKLVRTGVKRLSRAALEHFENIIWIEVRDPDNDISVEAVSPVMTLVLSARSVHLDAVLPDTLTRASITNWSEVTPVPWKGCASLEKLAITGAAATKLPSDWLSSCRTLSSLTLKYAPALTTVHLHTLRNAKKLRELSLTYCALRELPPRFLEHAIDLQILNLTGNQLLSLPQNFLLSSNRLSTLDLSSNQLTEDVYVALSFAPSLRWLRLDHNIALKNACPTSISESVTLWKISQLTELRLRNTSADSICFDWRQLLPKLTKLDLSANRITNLTASDLQFITNIEVDLQDNNITQLVYSRQDFFDLLADPDDHCEEDARNSTRASVTLSSELHCGCEMQWAVRALLVCPGHVRILHARCSSGVPLNEVTSYELMCDVPFAECPVDPPCRCTEREHIYDLERVLRVTCEHANLTRLPRLLAAPNITWELHLAHNHIAELDPADLPLSIQELDLRDNKLARFGPGVMSSLLVEGRRIFLADNPLLCDCEAAPTLKALYENQTLVEDFLQLRCPDGGRLLPPDDCVSHSNVNWPLLAGLMVMLLVIIAATTTWLAPSSRRARLVTILRGLGLLPRSTDPATDYLYDIFVSFSHHDHELVESIVERLESSTRPYRVCVHYRDWVPGGWIPTQIAASVRRSRCTMVIVSAHFLRSSWARAEFREAHAEALRCAEPRLLVVLLEDPETMPLDAELRRYLAGNTYLRWGDPWFWPKLYGALPAPLPRSITTVAVKIAAENSTIESSSVEFQ